MSTENKLAEVERAITKAVIEVGFGFKGTRRHMEQIVSKHLFPVICRLLDAAHADALRAAAEHYPSGNGLWVSHCSCGWRPEGGETSSCNYRKWQEHILALTPERARLERELANVLLREQFLIEWGIGCFEHHENNCKDCAAWDAVRAKRADLEAKLTALKSENKT